MATTEKEPAPIEKYLDAFDEIVLYRYPHVVGPPFVASLVLGVAWAAHYFGGAWPTLLTITTAVVTFLGLESVPHLPGARERGYAIACWASGTFWTIAAAWRGPFTGELPYIRGWFGWSLPPLIVAWLIILAAGWPPWTKHRRIRRAVDVSRVILAWDGDAVHLPRVNLSAAGAKADEDGWEAPLIPEIPGEYTTGKLEKALPNIAARFGAAIHELSIHKVRGDHEGKWMLRYRKAAKKVVPEYRPPIEQPTARAPFQIGHVSSDKTQPLMSEIWRKDHGGVDGLTAGQKGYGKLLALDTPVPTPTGWTTMGAIQDGDMILDDQGNPTRVVKAHDIEHDQPTYCVRFSDGSQVIAGGEHLWLTEDLRYRMARSVADKGRADRAKPVRRVLLPADRHERLREFAERESVATLAEVAEAAGVPWQSKLAQNSARTVSPVGTKRWMTSFTRGGQIVNRRAWARTYRTVELVEQFITFGGRPVNDQRNRGLAPQVRSTDEIRVTLRVGEHYNHAIRNARPLQLPEADLLVPPYVLGTWLGDGTTAAGVITSADPEMRLFIESYGYRTGPDLRRRGDNCETYTIYGLSKGLRAVGVLGNKHVPMSYLRAGERQRRELLAGLLDTDGTTSRNGQVQFAVMREQLALDVYELAASLGYRPILTSRSAKVDGRECGTVWMVYFGTDDPVYRLSRKAEAHKLRTARHNPERNATRAIVAVDPVPSVPMRCLTVDSSSRLYLVGKSMIPTHNTTYYKRMALHAVACKDALLFLADMKPGSPDYREIGSRGAYIYAKKPAEIDLLVQALLIICRVRGENPRKGRKVILAEFDETSLYFASTDKGSTAASKAAAANTDAQRTARWNSLIAVSRAFDVAIHGATQKGKERNAGGDARSMLLAGQVVGFYSPKPADSALLSGDQEFDLSSLPMGVPGECLIRNGIHPEVTRGTLWNVTTAVEKEMLDRFADGQGGLDPDELEALRAEFGDAWDELRKANRKTPFVVDAEPVDLPDVEPVAEPSTRATTPEESRQLVWQALASLGRPASVSEVADAAGRSKPLTQVRLRELIAERRVITSGANRWTRYEAVHRASDQRGTGSPPSNTPQTTR